jgi:predicted metal-binding membrane protein
VSEPWAVHRRVIVAVLVLLGASGWALMAWPRQDLTMHGMHRMGPTMGLTGPVFLAMWIVMMVAMMFPSEAPMVLAFHTVQAGKRARGQAFVATWVFVGAYFLVQSASGILAYLAARSADAFAHAAGLTATATTRIGGALLMGAGLYQISPWKNVCLTKCRTPMSFIINSWRDGLPGAIRMGVEHGLYCLGCCWALMAILLPLGIMNMVAMAGVTLLIFAEKTFIWGERAAAIASVLLVVYGAAVLLVPAALPS